MDAFVPHAFCVCMVYNIMYTYSQKLQKIFNEIMKMVEEQQNNYRKRNGRYTSKNVIVLPQHRYYNISQILYFELIAETYLCIESTSSFGYSNSCIFAFCMYLRLKLLYLVIDSLCTHDTLYPLTPIKRGS